MKKENKEKLSLQFLILTILVFHIGINFLNGIRAPSSNSSCKVKVFLSSKEKKKSNKDKKIAIFTR